MTGGGKVGLTKVRPRGFGVVVLGVCVVILVVLASGFRRVVRTADFWVVGCALKDLLIPCGLLNRSKGLLFLRVFSVVVDVTSVDSSSPSMLVESSVMAVVLSSSSSSSSLRGVVNVAWPVVRSKADDKVGLILLFNLLLFALGLIELAANRLEETDDARKSEVLLPPAAKLELG